VIDWHALNYQTSGRKKLEKGLEMDESHETCQGHYFSAKSGGLY